jgi:hypothetical protein
VNGVGLTASSLGQSAEIGFVCVTVDVTIENVGRDTLSYGPTDFKIVDGEGSEYLTACETDDGQLASGELTQGSQVAGKVALQVSQGASGLVLVYQPAPAEGRGAIEIELGP